MPKVSDAFKEIRFLEKIGFLTMTYPKLKLIPMRGLQNSDAQLKINHLLGLFVYKLLFCRLCSGVLQEAPIKKNYLSRSNIFFGTNL